MNHLNALLPIKCLRCGEPVDPNNIFVYDEDIYCGPCAYEVDPEFVNECEGEDA